MKQLLHNDTSTGIGKGSGIKKKSIGLQMCDVTSAVVAVTRSLHSVPHITQLHCI